MVELHDTIDQLRQAVAGFVDRCNSSWLIQRHGHQTPKEACQDAITTQRHDQIDVGAVQPTGRCSGALAQRAVPSVHQISRRNVWLRIGCLRR